MHEHLVLTDHSGGGGAAGSAAGLGGGGLEFPCGAIKEEKGIQRLEAMLYALDLINDDPHILPNITIGAVILDTCSSDTHALDQSMEFVRSYMNKDASEYQCESGDAPRYVPHKPITGVIGASFSTESIMVANILRLFKIPQISYASTSAELSDKSRFEYFSRVVPPDNFQAQALVEMVRQLGWKYVSTVAVEGDYGEKGIASFVTLAEAAGICIAVSEKILRRAEDADYDRIIERLSQKSSARGVVMFADEDETRRMLAATMRLNKTGQFLWVGSDSWGAKLHPVRDQEFAAEGAITILPKRSSLAGFDAYFKALRPKTAKVANASGNGENQYYRNAVKGSRIYNCRNPWFRQFWEQHFKCRFNSSASASGTGQSSSTLPECKGGDKLTYYEQEGLVPFVVDAVYAMAHAVHRMIADVCGHDARELCDELKPAPSGRNLLKYIRNVNFIGPQGQPVRFNKDGDAYGSYSFYQYQRHGSKYDYVRIGDWSASLVLNMSMLAWPNSTRGTIPRSICSDSCPNGYIRNFQDQCCWSCVSCREDSYSFNDTCVACAPGYAPNRDFNGCDKIPAEHLTWDSPWAIVPLVFTALGVTATLFTLTVFLRYNSTPMIMASGRELCYLLLTGILLCYLMAIPILAKPNVFTCSLLRVGLGFALCLCYSSILTKTNRISRIFNRGSKAGIKRPSYTSPKSQIVICCGLASIQLGGSLVWLMFERPSTKEVHPQPLTAILTCGVSNLSLVLSLLYNMLLIILCTFYAFKTRKIPENFNEAKYIGFTMYSTCIVWLAFVAIYFGTYNDYKIQTATLCVCVNISASVALGCLFVPKVYIVLFQPYKNVRTPGSGVINNLFIVE
ncbi:glutamate receptor, metabotropic [Daphnia pulex]|uniref:Glutamate receptor, metabotropic n=1 Tax=Daphnia pulex TaxID=6669 RepID=E9FZN7_DAPPU|nr:glutamate receptor, metabotropic [Daphnia pulex]|eukprot:EFX87236.1 glutamate receptor, metabotropic [Daphnia pulex]